MKIKDENIKLRKRNEVLSEDNVGLNKIIEELNNNKKLIKIKYNEEIQRYKNLLNSDKKIINNKTVNKDINEKYSNIKINNLNSKIDMDKYLLNRGEYMDILDENEKLHQKLKSLLSVNEDNIFKL